MALSGGQINSIRDAAILLEKINLEVARSLMEIAHQERPSGPLIKRKLAEYNKISSPKSKHQVNLKEMVDSGHVAIIPCGFRCETKIRLYKNLGLNQASMPFDNGFFPPRSIAKLINNGEINLHGGGSDANHTACVKYEGWVDAERGKGIKFKTSSYSEVDSLVLNSSPEDMNKYLDSTFGYYTLDRDNNYVLAHYNWHSLAKESHSKGVYQVDENIRNTNAILNKRLKRMIDLCDRATKVIFVTEELQGFRWMAIDDDFQDLLDTDVLYSAIRNRFGKKSVLTNLKDVSSPEMVMAFLEN